jgi:RNA polymerase sigma-70 factor (ECF subfamily)
MKERVYPQRVGAVLVDPRTDEDLMKDLAGGQQEALGPLYSRYAPLVFHLCVQSLDRTAAEELVQEVFLTMWRGAHGFDAGQGAFRPWLLRLTHWKILNELRRRRRRPVEAGATGPDDGDEPFEHVADEEPGPEERAWQHEHERILKSAVDSLPPKQRQAVAMAFLQDMTHEQVASALDVPLGTAKTRIRSGLQILRMQLAPVAASLLGLGLAVLGFRYVQGQIALDREQRALTLATTSDLAPLRLTPVASDVPAGAHANYRGRVGNTLAILTAEALPSPAAGSTYEAWVRHDDHWTSLGTFSPRPDGSAQLIAESPDLASAPDAVEVTLEPASGAAQAPGAQVVLAWQ